EEGKDSLAKEYLDKAIDLNPKNIAGYMARANFWQQGGGMAKAEADLRKAYALAPGNSQISGELAEWHLARAASAAIPQSLAYLQAAYRIDQDYPGLEQRLVSLWFDKNAKISAWPDSLRNQAAAMCLNLASRHADLPASPVGFLQRALILASDTDAIRRQARQGAWGQLQTMLSRADFASAYQWYQEIEKQVGWNEDQRVRLHRQLSPHKRAQFPLSPATEVGMLQLLAATGNLSMDQRLKLGRALSELGQVDAAEEVFRLAYQMDARLYTVALAWAEALFLAGKDERAAEKFMLATQLGPEAPEVWLAYGYLKLNTRQYSQALEHFTQARNLWEQQASNSQMPPREAIDLYSGAAFCGQIMGLEKVAEQYYPKAEAALSDFRKDHLASNDQAWAHWAEARLAGFRRESGAMRAALEAAEAAGMPRQRMALGREPFNRYEG
ncbi:MAG: hypothetical protein AAFV07_18620, partial [Bacteroidota bacterium]